MSHAATMMAIMAETPLRLGIVTSSHDEAPDVAARLDAAAAARGFATVAIGLGRIRDVNVDVVVGIGGDGTLLEAAQIAYQADLPVVGVNLGTVGYLTEFEPDELDLLLDTLAGSPLQEWGRMTVLAEAPGERVWYGINDVVIEKVLSQRVVRIAVTIDGEYFTTYRADGIIVATPLGSTAYSLSVGGPVLAPELEALVLSPVAPHSLLTRSLVLAPDTEIRFRVASDRAVRVNLDGREACVLGEGEELVVRRGLRPVRFVSLGTHPFPQGVRKQFGLDHA
jgi:NAD+ kinase